MPTSVDITQLLHAWSNGEEEAFDRLVPVVYDHLRQLAHARLQNERASHTLSTTALVHEAYLKLADIERMEWKSRAHFMAMASRMMRRVLIDYARRRNALKRGGEMDRLMIDIDLLPASRRYVENVLDLDEALTRLEDLHARSAQVIEYRYFGGLTQKETAEALGISPSTVKRDQRFARAWLAQELSKA